MRTRPNQQTKRNLLICRLYYRDGMEMPRIAEKFGLTKQRVFAILKRWGGEK